MVSLTVISVDRFLAVYFPLTYHKKMTRLTATVALVTAWTPIVAIILTPLLGEC